MLTVMPEHAQRAHAPDEFSGDRLHGPHSLDAVSHNPLGPDKIRAADCNFRWTWDNPTNRARGGETWALHDRTPGGKGSRWRFILEPGAATARPMSKAELTRPVNQWATADVYRWRRTADPRSERPATYQEMATYAVKVGVRIIAELKADEFTLPITARHLVASAHAAGHPPWFMALFGILPGCRAKCRAIENAGGQFAVIFGRWRATYSPLFHRHIRAWHPQPTRIWGYRKTAKRSRR